MENEKDSTIVQVNPGTEKEIILTFNKEGWTVENYYKLVKLFKQIFPERKEIDVKNLIAWLHNHSL